MSTKWVFTEMFDRLPALGETPTPVTKATRRPDSKLTFRGTVYIAALGIWAVIGLVCWLLTLVT
jgi:hypothetical protein